MLLAYFHVMHMSSDLTASRLIAALEGTRFRHVEVHDEVESTQTILSKEDGPDGRVVVADHQTSGRGRAGRQWTSPPGRSLMFSTLLRGIAPESTPLVCLAAAVAVSRAIAMVDLDPRLKWPNDVLLDGKKVCGILGELAPGGEYVVLGAGVNVSQTAEELPPDVEATSLRLMGANARRGELLVDILRNLDGMLAANDWMGEYRERCATIGTPVRVQLQDEILEGRATRVRDDGALVVDGRAVVAGDVVHLR